jgi:hypothetical protein
VWGAQPNQTSCANPSLRIILRCSFAFSYSATSAENLVFLLLSVLLCAALQQPKGGAFTGDEKEFFRFKLGDHSVIPAFEEGLTGMRVGGIRRLIVPVELGYPDNDMNKLGPKPTTFSGE